MRISFFLFINLNRFCYILNYGRLEEVKYLLSSSNLEFNANIHYDNGNGFLLACKNGHSDIAEYLLSSPDLKEHINININIKDDEGLKWACRNGHLKIAKYLLTSLGLKVHANIHAGSDAAFRLACENNQMNIVEYFIFDYKIKKTERITEYLKEKPNGNIENMFKVRDLSQNLEKELSSDKTNKKKIKL